MAPSSAEREALERQIAALTGAISNHSSSSSFSRPSRGRGGKLLAGSSSHPYNKPLPNGNNKRGNANKTLIINNSNNSNNNNNNNAQAGPSRLHPPPSASTPTSGSSSPLPANLIPLFSTEGQPGSGPSQPEAKGPGGRGWVKGTTKAGNKTLTNVDVHMKAEKARQIRDSKPKQPSSSSTPHTRKPRSRYTSQLPVYGSIQSYETTLSGSAGQGRATNGVPGGEEEGQGKGGERKRVVIDGVVFEFDKDGKKLTRMDDPPITPTTSLSFENIAHSPHGTPTRQTLSMSGHQFIRTKNGNMISAEVVRMRKGSVSNMRIARTDEERKQKGKLHCRYFTKTGRCNRASTCPYIHDPNRLSICSRFLRSTCTLTTFTCPVSHTPSPHNTPSCAHFQQTGTCKNGSDCLYPHVKVSEDAPVCQSFAVEGWCEKQAGRCEEKHAWECKEFNEKGRCEKGVRCSLAHVLRAKSVQQQQQVIETVKGSNDSTTPPKDDKKTTAAATPSNSEKSMTGVPTASGADATAASFTGDAIADQQDFIQFLPSDEGVSEPGKEDDDVSDDASVSSEGDNDDEEDSSEDEDDEEEDEDETMDD